MRKIFSTKTHWFVALLLAAALLFTATGCNPADDDDDDDNSSSSSTASTTDATLPSSDGTDDDDDSSSLPTTYATLPSSVGTNELSGKSWTYRNETWTFNSDGTATFTENLNSIYTYNYTYNSNSKLVYLGLKSASFSNGSENFSYSSVAEVKSQAEAMGRSGDELERDVAQAALEFATKLVFRYDIDDTAKTLKLIWYFDGELPTSAGMSSYGSSTSSIYIVIDDGGFEIRDYSSGSSKYKIYPTFSNGSFSGTLFHGDTSLGTAAGTYTTSGTGTTNSSVTLTFTALPSSFTILSTNTAYKLKLSDETKFHTYTYTLQQ